MARPRPHLDAPAAPAGYSAFRNGLVCRIIAEHLRPRAVADELATYAREHPGLVSLGEISRLYAAGDNWQAARRAQ